MRKLSAAVICGRQLAFYIVPPGTRRTVAKSNKLHAIFCTQQSKEHIYSLSIVQSYRGQVGYVHPLAFRSKMPDLLYAVV